VKIIINYVLISGLYKKNPDVNIWVETNWDLKRQWMSYLSW